MGNIFDCAANPLGPLPGDEQTSDGSHSAPTNAQNGKPFAKDADGNPLYPLDAKNPTSRLSDSILWRLQRMFYETKGTQPWKDGTVPNFVTSNACIASSYAKVIMGLLRDIYVHHTAGNAAEPLYIIETGAGHGKLAYLIIESLLRWEEHLPKMENGKPPFVYVLTETGEAPINDWKDHVSLRPLYEQEDSIELLDFALFDVTKDKKIHLQLRDIDLDAKTLANPPVFICNYVFDSIPMDAYRIEDGTVKEGAVSVVSTQQETDLSNPDILSRIRCKWEYRLLDDSKPPYDSEEENAILKYYESKLKDASFLIPNGAIQFLENAKEMTNNNALVLVGDKGYLFEEELLGHREPHVAMHGSFSMMVNFHALRLWMERTALKLAKRKQNSQERIHANGFMETTRQMEGFKCAALYLGGKKDDFVQTRMAWKDSVVECSPEDFSALQRKVREEIPNPSLRLVLALLRLSCHDSDVFCKFKTVLIEKSSHPYSNEDQIEDIKNIDLERIHAAYFPLQPSKDVCFEMARMLMGLKMYTAALEFFDRSLSICGEHHVTYHNMGMCHYFLENLSQSLEMFRTSLSINPKYQGAREWLEKVTQRMHAAGYDDIDDEESVDNDSESESD
eukprot:gb/GECG01010691.1/.p1 GENE.gb/GECG01010691.1/~~gb/GECG01010691.1/.p1  ORF type:complete len:620 (+),score=83.99 gb/GECG01010691.1/:1-1860(+)